MLWYVLLAGMVHNMEIIQQGQNYVLKPQTHRRTFVFLHGLGDQASSFVPMFNESNLIADCKYVLLTAPVRPVTVNGGMHMTSWFDIRSLDGPEVGEVNNEMIESAEIVSRVLEEESKLTDELILGGLSQGGILSLYTGLYHYPSALKAIVCLSGFLAKFEPKPERSGIPLFIYHGHRDGIIPSSLAMMSYQNLRNFNTTIDAENTMGHEISETELGKLKQWLGHIFN